MRKAEKVIEREKVQTIFTLLELVKVFVSIAVFKHNRCLFDLEIR